MYSYFYFQCFFSYILFQDKRSKNKQNSYTFTQQKIIFFKFPPQLFEEISKKIALVTYFIIVKTGISLGNPRICDKQNYQNGSPLFGKFSLEVLSIFVFSSSIISVIVQVLNYFIFTCIWPSINMKGVAERISVLASENLCNIYI